MKWVLMCAAVVAVCAALWQLSRARSFQLFGTLVDRVDTRQQVVALTFDDGPSVRYTQDVLDMLAALDVVATFYLTGDGAHSHPDGVAAIAAAGHEIGNHSYSHRRMVVMRPSVVRDELARTDEAIRAAGYDGPLTFRPPYGKKLVVLPWVVAQQQRVTVTWDVAVEAPGLEAAQIAEQVIAQAQPGSIILLHVMFENGGASREAVPLIVEGLRVRGFDFVTISALLAQAD